jgi:hypothetical protein
MFVLTPLAMHLLLHQQLHQHHAQPSNNFGLKYNA